MGLNGRLVSKITIKSSMNKFRDQLWFAPHQLADISPQNIQSVELGAGKWGTAGSINTWTFFNPDGKKVVAKEVVEAAEDREGKKVITKKVIGGDLLEVYKAFKIVIDAEVNGEGTVVTVIAEYEKKSEAMPEPRSFMNVCFSVVKDIERNHLLVPN